MRRRRRFRGRSVRRKVFGRRGRAGRRRRRAGGRPMRIGFRM